jgi:hypothetical protein
MRNVFTATWLALACLVAAASAGAQAPAPGPARGLSKQEAGLVDADSARFRAMVARDIPALDRLLADELVYVHSSSTRQSKNEHLDDIRAGKATYARIEPREQVPSLYGNTGIIQGVAAFTTGAADRQVASVLRYTSVYVRRQGRWQMVAFACSRIPDRP